MCSRRKEKAKKRRSRQANQMSDVDNLDVMLGSYARNELESNSEDRNVEVDVESKGPRQDVVQKSEDFRSLLKFK